MPFLSRMIVRLKQIARLQCVLRQRTAIIFVLCSVCLFGRVSAQDNRNIIQLRSGPFSQTQMQEFLSVDKKDHDYFVLASEVIPAGDQNELKIASIKIDDTEKAILKGFQFVGGREYQLVRRFRGSVAPVSYCDFIGIEGDYAKFKPRKNDVVVNNVYHLVLTTPYEINLEGIIAEKKGSYEPPREALNPVEIVPIRPVAPKPKQPEPRQRDESKEFANAMEALLEGATFQECLDALQEWRPKRTQIAEAFARYDQMFSEWLKNYKQAESRFNRNDWEGALDMLRSMTNKVKFPDIVEAADQLETKLEYEESSLKSLDVLLAEEDWPSLSKRLSQHEKNGAIRSDKLSPYKNALQVYQKFVELVEWRPPNLPSKEELRSYFQGTAFSQHQRGDALSAVDLYFRSGFKDKSIVLALMDAILDGLDREMENTSIDRIVTDMDRLVELYAKIDLQALEGGSENIHFKRSSDRLNRFLESGAGVSSKGTSDNGLRFLSKWNSSLKSYRSSQLRSSYRAKLENVAEEQIANAKKQERERIINQAQAMVAQLDSALSKNNYDAASRQRKELISYQQLNEISDLESGFSRLQPKNKQKLENLDIYDAVDRKLKETLAYVTPLKFDPKSGQNTVKKIESYYAEQIVFSGTLADLIRLRERVLSTVRNNILTESSESKKRIRSAW